MLKFLAWSLTIAFAIHIGSPSAFSACKNYDIQSSNTRVLRTNQNLLTHKYTITIDGVETAISITSNWRGVKITRDGVVGQYGAPLQYRSDVRLAYNDQYNIRIIARFNPLLGTISSTRVYVEVRTDQPISQ